MTLNASAIGPAASFSHPSQLRAGVVIALLSAMVLPTPSLGRTEHARPAPTMIAAEQSTPARANEPLRLVFDTDMWSDVDDALALAMVHALQNRGEVQLLAVTISVREPVAATYVDLVNRFYCHPGIPVGMTRRGVDGAAIAAQVGVPGLRESFTASVAASKGLRGRPLYPRRLRPNSSVPDAVGLLRRSLAAQPDNSVVVMQAGFSTNLAALLRSSPDRNSRLRGRDLVRRKVRALVAMAGRFGDGPSGGTAGPAGSVEWNFRIETDAARALLRDWPTPIVLGGSELGDGLIYAGTRFAIDMGWTRHHPIRDAYLYLDALRMRIEHTSQPDHPRGLFDLAPLLYATRPEGGYFSVSAPGEAVVLDGGASRFEFTRSGRHRFLVQDDAQRHVALEAITALFSAQPSCRSDENL